MRPLSIPAFISRRPSFVSAVILTGLIVLGFVSGSAQNRRTPLEPEDTSCCFEMVEGYVFYDIDGDSVWNGGDYGLQGWTVEAYGFPSNAFISSTTTDSNGYYTFTNVSCGSGFRLSQVTEPGWTQTFPPGNAHVDSVFSCAGELFGPYNFGNTAPPCQGISVTYTLDAEFNLGTLSGVVTNSDQLELAPTGTTFEFAWIANSGEGTISKVSTVTGDEVARYRTGPPDSTNSGLYLQPSRTVVDENGNCWVANRNFSGQASVIQILADEGEDRNFNTNIETSTDLNSNGTIEPAEMYAWGLDERVVRNYLVGTGYPDNTARGLAIDKEGFLWVGLFDGQRVVKLDPTLSTAIYAPNLLPTAPPELASVSTVPHFPYGLALSPDGMIYAGTISGWALEIDPGIASGGTGAGPAVTDSIDHGGANYGIAVDQDCIVWLAKIFDQTGTDGCVRWDPAVGVGNPALGWSHALPGAPGPGRGITVDFDGNIWMACNDTLHSVAKYAPTDPPTWLANYPTGALFPIGIGVGPDEHMIVTGGTSVWDKLNKNTGASIPLPGPQLAGPSPYTYSDFTGSLQNLVSKQQGFWTVITDGLSNAIKWVLVDWAEATPPNTSVTVEARVASSLSALSTTAWQVISTPGPLTSPIPGRYIETRVRLIRELDCGEPFVTPVLFDLTVEAECDTCFFVDCPEDTTVICQTEAGAVVTYDPPVLFGECDSSYVVTCFPPSGSVFPIGVTTVYCQAQSQQYEDLPECTFNVTVTDDCIMEPTGACCVGNLCFETTEHDCHEAGGIYHGDFTNCQQIDCDEDCATPPNGLTGWWPLDVSPGNVTPNLGDPSRPGSLIGPPSGVVGQYVTNAMQFDGVSDYIRVNDGPSLNLGPGDLSIDCWLRTTKTSLNPILDKRDGNGMPIQGYHFFLSGGYPGLQLAVGNSFTNYILSAGNGGAQAFVADGNWHMVAVTVDRNDPNGIRFYVDGVAVGSAFNPTAHQGNLNNSEDLWIGRSHPILVASSHFDGDLDEVELFRREIPAADIAAIFRAGTSGKCREACYTPKFASCCTGSNANSYITIWNYSETSHVYSWGLSPLSGPGCTGTGANSFYPASGTVTLGPGSGISIAVSIPCPTNVPPGSVSCYLVSVYNHDTGRTFGCAGSVRKPKWWCPNWTLPGGIIVSGTIGITPGVTKSIELDLKHIGLQPAPVDVPIEIHPLIGEGDSSSAAVSLDGLPPGEPVVRTVKIPPGEGGILLPLTIDYTIEQPIGFDRLELRVDDDMDGNPESVATLGLRGSSGLVSGVIDGEVPDPTGGGKRPFLALPNPFSPSSRIAFRLVGEAKMNVTLQAFDLRGRLVRTFYRKTPLDPGDYSVVWDGTNDRGLKAPNGVYFLRLVTPEATESVKAVLMK